MVVVVVLFVVVGDVVCYVTIVELGAPEASWVFIYTGGVGFIITGGVFIYTVGVGFIITGGVFI